MFKVWIIWYLESKFNAMFKLDFFVTKVWITFDDI